MKDIITNLDTRKATGLDDISVRMLRMLKLSKSRISVHIMALINRIIHESVYPDNLKKARIIPIYRNIDPENDPENYRRISILNNISKIIEKYFTEKLQENVKRFLNINQFGFTKNISTLDALFHIQFEIIKGRNENKCQFNQPRFEKKRLIWLIDV